MIRRVKFAVFGVGLGVLAAISNAQDATPQKSQPGTTSGIQPLTTVTTQPDDASLLQKSSYIIGFNMTSRLLSDLDEQGVQYDLPKLIDGMQAAIKGEKIGMTEEEIRNVMMAFQKVVEKQQIEKMTLAANKNKAEGEAFLTANSKKENVKQLPNGVQYEVIEEGTGPSPTADEIVKVHYHGTLPDGTPFESTIRPLDGSPPLPTELQVGRFVPGFSAALQAMKVGSKWKVAIPGELAYGMNSQGPIGPNQTLLFELHLLEIVK